MQSVIKNAKTSVSILRIMDKSLQEEAQKTKIVYYYEKNYKCTRGHKHSVFKYSLHVNNREIDQEKENKTAAL